MKKIFIYLFCALSLFSCSNNNLNNNSNKDMVDEFTFEQERIDTNNKFIYQYNIRFRNNDVDIRTFMYHGHEYIIGVSYLSSGGGMDIEHSASCPNKIHKNENR